MKNKKIVIFNLKNKKNLTHKNFSNYKIIIMINFLLINKKVNNQTNRINQNNKT